MSTDDAGVHGWFDALNARMEDAIAHGVWGEPYNELGAAWYRDDKAEFHRIGVELGLWDEQGNIINPKGDSLE